MIATLRIGPSLPCGTISFNRILCLALALINITLSGCSVLQDRYSATCKSRAYLRIPLEEYLTNEFPSGSMVRLGIIPLVTPANLAGYSDQNPPLGAQLAWRLHGEMLRLEVVPIVEVTAWHDWPIKREDFFTGNFEALERARQTGYTLVFVGYLEQSSPEEAAVLGKIIDVRAGLTLWYGRTYVLSHTGQVNNFTESLYPSRDHTTMHPDMFGMYNKLMECVAAEALGNSEPDQTHLGPIEWFSAILP